MQMSFPVRFPAIYERVSPVRTVEEIEREMDRRCGIVPMDVIPPVRHVDPEEAREGTYWERKSAIAAIRQKVHEPMPPQQSRATCKHENGTVKGGGNREKCRACGLTRVIGRSWKRLVPLRKSKSMAATA